MTNKTKVQMLTESSDMAPVEGTVDVDIPVAALWECFARANLWPRWNKCFFWTRNRDLIAGRQLIWIFQPIRWWLLYKMPAIAKIVEVEPQKKVTWEVTALPGFYARHTYFMNDVGNGRTRFGSWEKARGWSFRLMKWFWVRHFIFVKDRSLEGARSLEGIYRREGRLDGFSDETNLMRRGRIGLAAGLAAVLMTTVLNLIGRAIGLLPEAMDLKHMAEFVADPRSALLWGIVIHLISGCIVGMVYTLLMKSYTPKSGVLFMLALWLVMMLVASPLADRGFFALAEGPALPISTFILHVVFGALIGAIARKMSLRY